MLPHFLEEVSIKIKPLVCEELGVGVCFQLLTSGSLSWYCLLLDQWSRVSMMSHTPGQLVFLLLTETPHSALG